MTSEIFRQRAANLSEVCKALDFESGVSSVLERRHQERRQNGDNRDHHEKFKDGEAARRQSKSRKRLRRETAHGLMRQDCRIARSEADSGSVHARVLRMIAACNQRKLLAAPSHLHRMASDPDLDRLPPNRWEVRSFVWNSRGKRVPSFEFQKASRSDLSSEEWSAPRTCGPRMDSQEHIDWQLMQRVAASDEEAIEQLYARFGALVYQSARQVLRSRAETEDAVQEVFVRLWRTADRFDPHRAKLVTWVMLITRRHLIDRLRRQSARPDRAELDGSRSDGGGAIARPVSEGVAEGGEGRDRLRRQLSRLPELQRTVIERAYLQGFSLREIAAQLDAPLGTVKSALSRGLTRLRELEGGEERRGS